MTLKGWRVVKPQHNQSKMSQCMIKPTKWCVFPAKTQISLGIHPVWSVFAVSIKKAWVLSYILSAQHRLIRLGRCLGWSEFPGHTYNFVGFVVCWVKLWLSDFGKWILLIKSGLCWRYLPPISKRDYRAQLCSSSRKSRGFELEPKHGPINFMEIDHEIISMVIFLFLMIQEGPLSITCTGKSRSISTG